MTTEQYPSAIPPLEPALPTKTIDESSPTSVIPPHPTALPTKTIDESSPTSVIPPHPTISSPTYPPVAPEHQPPHAIVPSVAHHTKSDEGQVDTPRSQADAEATSASSTALVPTSEGGSRNRDEALAKVNHDRTYSHIRAWEENEKAKSLNKFNKIVSKINAWENTRKSTAEAKLRKAEETLEKKRATYVERMKNEIAAVHRDAEEKRAVAEAKRGEEHVQAEETAAKYKASGHIPKRMFCFGG